MALWRSALIRGTPCMWIGNEPDPFCPDSPSIEGHYQQSDAMKIDLTRALSLGASTRNVLLGALVIAAVLLPAVVWAQRAQQVVSERQARQQKMRLTVASPYRIPTTALAGTIQYRFAAAAHWPWPATGEQRVRKLGLNAELTVCQHCGAEAVPTDEALVLLLRPNRWVDSDHARVVRFARQFAGKGSVDQRMRRLEQAVRDHMNGEVDYRFYASASEALRLRRGDCTEFAVLLAAAARAAGIPTRVVFGIAYASRFGEQSHVFTPHMWVQSWDGLLWRSYDAGLGGFSSGSIALMVDDGRAENANVLQKFIEGLRIQSAVELRPAASEERPASRP